MSHTHRGPRARAQNDPGPRQQTDSGWVFGKRGVRERRGPPAPDTPTQSETELMNEQGAWL